MSTGPTWRGRGTITRRTTRTTGTTSASRYALLAFLVLAASSSLARGQETPVLAQELARRLRAAEEATEKGRYGRAIEGLESLRELLAATAGTGGKWAALDGRASELRDLALRLREARGDAPAPDEPESARERVARLIAELGSNEWAERERAERLLLSEGKEAPDLLEAAQEDPDLEIRERAARVLEKIRAPGSGRPFHFLLGKVLWVAGGTAYVDLGAAAGLAPGTTGVTYRPDEFGARVRASDVRADWAAVEILEAIRGGEARPGDLAEFSTEFGK